jgi:SNF2 family DNA or RNA helicase
LHIVEHAYPALAVGSVNLSIERLVNLFLFLWATIRSHFGECFGICPQRASYQETLERLRADYQRRVKAGEIVEKGELLVALNHLRHVGSFAKTETALTLVEEVQQQEQQVVVFVDFVDSAKRLVGGLQAEGIQAGLLIGETPKKDRAPLVKRFQSGQVRVLVATLDTGGVGLTLTAATTVILNDRPWTSEDAKQAEDRLHRIGRVNA